MLVILNYCQIMITASTHPGPPTKENQDAHFVMKLNFGSTEVDALFIGDGHGRVHGQAIANEVKASFISSLNTISEHPETFFQDSDASIVSIFDDADKHVRAKLGVRHKCGTTATLALRFSEEMIVAHVGDSCGYITGPARDPVFPFSDHSPESMSEYLRIKSIDGDTTRFLYDSLTTRCGSDIFKHTHMGIHRTGNVQYYKDVSNHSATVISAGGTSLAYTRSFGDYSIPSAIHTPDIWHGECPDGATVILASDGVWDNWDVRPVSLARELQTLTNGDATQALILNEERAKTNFGASRDNATIIIAKY